MEDRQEGGFEANEPSLEALMLLRDPVGRARTEAVSAVKERRGWVYEMFWR